MFRSIIKRLPVIHELIAERDELHSELSGIKRHGLFVQPGHFYSPIPSQEDIEKYKHGQIPRKLPGINLSEEEQLKLLESFKPFYDSLPFQPEETEKLRYHYNNPSYSYSPCHKPVKGIGGKVSSRCSARRYPSR